MGRPHSLGRCHLRGVWATCLPHKGGGVPLSALLKDITIKLPDCFPHLVNAEREAGKQWIPFFKVFWYGPTRGLNPRSTDYEADALTTMHLPWLNSIIINSSIIFEETSVIYLAKLQTVTLFDRSKQCHCLQFR